MATTQKDYEEAKQVLAEIQNELRDPTLSPEHRRELELHAAKLSGFLMSPWLPFATTRSVIMAGIFLLGLLQAANGGWHRGFGCCFLSSRLALLAKRRTCSAECHGDRWSR